MAKYHGKVTAFTIDDSGGSPVDLSAYVTDVSFDIGQDVADATTKGSTAKEHTVGHYGATATVSGRYDDTASTGPDVVFRALAKSGASGTVLIEWGGGGVGTDSTSGEATVTRYSRSSPLAGTVDFSADLEFTGAITEADIT